MSVRLSEWNLGPHWTDFHEINVQPAQPAVCALKIKQNRRTTSFLHVQPSRVAIREFLKNLSRKFQLH